MGYTGIVTVLMKYKAPAIPQWGTCNAWRGAVNISSAGIHSVGIKISMAYAVKNKWQRLLPAMTGITVSVMADHRVMRACNGYFVFHAAFHRYRNGYPF